MCGIAGFALSRPADDPAGIVRRMTARIAHRGPDDGGVYVDNHVALGHRRLSIIDVSAGHQPMGNEDGSVQIVFNGEIFNHTTLRSELEHSGHQYRTHCDTETIIHCYEQFGAECVNRLRGMFAFAIWDGRRKRLFCARDRLGKKPFYYFSNSRVFVFASEIKAILAHPGVSASLAEESLPEYLAFGYTSETATLFKGIHQLPPGHHLTVDLRGTDLIPVTKEYWDVPCPPSEGYTRPEAELVQETRRRLETAVETRLMSDVPLGMFLSGGVDSSAIAAIAQRYAKDRVQTFSVGYEEARYSELPYAKQVADHIGAEHREVRVGFDSFFGQLPSLVWHEDKPITWPSSVSLYFVSRLASQHVKVVLTGEGCDELFGGYERYRWTLLNAGAAKAYGSIPAPLRRALASFVRTSPLLRASLRRKISHTFLARDPSIQSLLLDNFYAAFDPAGQRALWGQTRLAGGQTHSSDAQKGDTAYASYLRAFRRHPGLSPLQRMLYADQKTYLVELLMKQDRMSMAASIESRVPILDHELVEFASSIPDRCKIRGGVQKWIFKKAVEDLLPHAIVHRKKLGFPTPVAMWLRSEQAGSLYQRLLDRDGYIASLFELSAIHDLVERHQAGTEDATDRLWRLLSLQIWGDLFITGRPERWLANTAERGTPASA